MISRVIVGVDFSAASRQALDRGAAWAQRLGVPLLVMHVLQSPVSVIPEAQVAMPDPAWLEATEAHAKTELNTWIKNIPNAEAKVKWGGPAEELVGEADGDSLLVVAQVGHSVLERLLFGSTASRVVKHAPCDVLVVRTKA